MMDGTENSNHQEMEAVLLRFWDGEHIVEHVINIAEAKDRSAKGLLTILLDTLDEHGIPLDGLASDSFDGASVNSGWRGLYT